MKSCCLLLALLFPTFVFAAGQIPEKLRFDGLEEHLMATPLEDYWTDAHPKPATLTQTSLACWRGYVGTWEIIEYKLHLLRLERHEIRPKGDSFVEQTVEVPLKPLFGQEGPIPADWFSGVLRVARGDVLVQVNAGYASVYEEDVFFIIDHGIIVSRRTLKNSAANVTSESDLAWRELARISPTGAVRAELPEEALEAEQGNWLSLPELTARKDELLKNKASFEVRGIRFPGKIWFPGMNGTDVFYPLETTGLQGLPAPGQAIEATCTLVEADNCVRLVASEVIELPPGLAIQRSKPQAKNNNLQTAAKVVAGTDGT
jgi:hypothetical protein